MTKCGAWSLLWGPTFDRESLYLVEHVKDFGFDGIEIPLTTQILKNLPIRKLKERLSENGLAATFCAGLESSQNVATNDKRKQRRGIEHLKKCVQTVAEFNSDFLAGILYGVWGGFSGNPPTEDELNWSAECIREVAEYAEPLKVDLAIEPCSRFECYLIATAQEGLRYLKKVGKDNVGLLLDAFQMNIEEKSLSGAILKAGDKLYHFHVCASDRGIPGTGHIDWEGVFGALRKIGYKRWLTVESFWPRPGGGAGAAAKVWRQLAPTPDHIARGGLELVRKYLP
jgi:D-psicose/D-tagatose/L-ribulose 3-epimerase